MAPFGPLATIVSKASPSAPRSVMARSSEMASSRSVTPGRIRGTICSNAREVISQARASSAISCSSLAILISSTARPSGTSSVPGTWAAKAW